MAFKLWDFKAVDWVSDKRDVFCILRNSPLSKKAVLQQKFGTNNKSLGLTLSEYHFKWQAPMWQLTSGFGLTPNQCVGLNQKLGPNILSGGLTNHLGD